LAAIDDFPAFDQVSQTNFSISVTFPHKTSSHALIRFRYQSNNLDEVDQGTTIFYNCADIAILAASVGSEPLLPKYVISSSGEDSLLKSKKTKSQTSLLCATPALWTVTATQVFNTPQEDVIHHIYYDYSNNRTAWFKKTSSSELILINDYNTLVEYVIDPHAHTCQHYGADKFYSWTFGGLGMTYYPKYPAGFKGTFFYRNPSNGHSWLLEETKGISGKANVTCQPLVFTDQFSTTYFDDLITHFDSSVFNVTQYGCSGSDFVQRKGCSPRKSNIGK